MIQSFLKWKVSTPLYPPPTPSPRGKCCQQSGVSLLCPTHHTHTHTRAHTHTHILDTHIFKQMIAFTPLHNPSCHITFTSAYRSVYSFQQLYNSPLYGPSIIYSIIPYWMVTCLSCFQTSIIYSIIPYWMVICLSCFQTSIIYSIIPYWTVICLSCFQISTLKSNSKIRSPLAYEYLGIFL